MEETLPRKKVGRKALPKNKKKKGNNIGIPFSDDDLKTIRQNAEKFGMKFNPFVRHAAINFNTKGTKKRGLQEIISPEINRKTLMELSKIGSNINQISRAINQGRTIFPDEFKIELVKLNSILIQISKELNLK